MKSFASGFDYIIIGAGAAGCVLANRLSAEPATRVALIEAGPSDRHFPTNIKTTMPIGNIFLLPHARYNWKHSYRGGDAVNQRQIPCPRGMLLGGCTSVNGTVYIRGHRSDYDDWAALGNPGWSYADVLPVYKRLENRRAPVSPFHGHSGELDVQRPVSSNPLAHAFVAAAVSAGHVRNDDFNGEQQDGVGIYELNQRNGVRLSNSRAFLHPIMQRPNLQVFTDTLVEKINLNGGRALGITMRHKGQRHSLTASCEVVLTAGTVNSPQLLMLSGIGPKAALQRHGIATLVDLPGVGANLQDHPTVSIAMANPSAQSYALSWRTAPRVAMAPLRYLFGRQGMLASNAAEAGGFMRSLPGLSRPDIQFTFMVGMKTNPRTLPRQHGFILHVAILRPSTRGYLELGSADPAARPILIPNFLEDRGDVQTLIRGLKEARRIMSMPELAKLSSTELVPGRTTASDEQLEAYIRSNLATTYHPAGTCKMGPSSDPMAVVNERLLVYGVTGLCVADASIMPDLIGGNTAAPATMIGERAADFILRNVTAGVLNGIAA